MKTIYFLGAGASKAIEPSMPTAAELTVEHLLDVSNYPNAEPPPTAIPELRDAVARGVLRSGFARLRLEEALSEIAGRVDLRSEYHSLQICLVRRLGTPTSFLTFAESRLGFFLRAVQEDRDAIITTNYDTLIESALASTGSGVYRSRHDAVDVDCRGWIDYGADGVPQVPHSAHYSYELLGEARASLPLLKVHGSISWSHCTACGYSNLDQLHNFGLESALDRWGKCPRPECRSEQLEGVIVPPTFNKIYEGRVIQAIWNRASRLLSTCSRIIFAGFSLHPSDVKIRELLAVAIKGGALQEVLLVDPAAHSLESQYRELFGGVVGTRAVGWTEYLNDTFSLEDFERRQARRRSTIRGC